MVYSQSELYSLKIEYSPVEATFLNSVNPKTADIAEISPSSIAPYYNPVGGSAVDPINNYYYVLSMVDMTTQALLTIDLNTGNVINQPIIFNPDEIHQMAYNCVDSTLYAIEVVWEPNERYLVTVNPETGVTTRVSKAPIFEWYTTHSMTIIDPVKNIFYTLGTDKNDIYHFYGVDLSTGAIVSDPIVQNPDDYHQIAFNCMDSSIYAIKVVWEPNERYLMKIDPETGIATQLSKNSIFEWYKTEQRTTIDPTVGLMYLIATDKQDVAGMYALNLETGEVDLNIPINSIDDYHQLRNLCSCFPEGDFEYNVVACDSTEFEVIYASGKYEWNFGDPNSGSSNKSTLKNPKHLFSQDGSYEVQLVVKGCYSYDTIKKQVNISASGNLNLGNDTILCENETLLLDATSPASTYLWQDGSVKPTYLVTTTDDYIVQVYTKKCVLNDTIHVEFVQKPEIDLGDDAIICASETLTLDAFVPQGIYTWQDNSSASTYTVTQSGTYSIVVDGAGCGATDEINVEVISVSVDLGPDIEVCEGNVHVLNAYIPNASYIWNNGSTDPIFTVTTDGNYSVEVSQFGCKNSDDIFVRFKTPPVLDLGNDVSICEGDSYEIFTSLSGIYTWQDGSTEDRIQVSESGNYWLQLVSGVCIVSDTVEVLVQPIPELNLGIDRNYCKGDKVILDAGDGDSYLWQNGSTKQSIYVEEPGKYSVTKTVGSCNVSDEVYIGFDILEDVYMPSDTVLCDGRSIYLNVFVPDAKYTWQDSSEKAHFLITKEGEYSVEISKGTCSQEKTVMVEVQDCNCCLYIPEAFAPNNPAYGVRQFKPRGMNLETYKITIFDKWGNIVWYSDKLTPAGSPAEGWNGVYNGIPLEQGAYIWRIQAVFRSGEEWLQDSNKTFNYGAVELLR